MTKYEFMTHKDKLNNKKIILSIFYVSILLLLIVIEKKRSLNEYRICLCRVAPINILPIIKSVKK